MDVAMALLVKHEVVKEVDSRLMANVVVVVVVVAFGYCYHPVL